MSLAGENRDILARGLLVIFSVTARDCPLRQALIYWLIREYRSRKDEEEDGMRWCMWCMLEEGVEKTRWVCQAAGVEMERLVERGDEQVRKIWEKISKEGGDRVGL